ncbi:MAG TPA: isochorismate synthase [Nitrolancea sp.]|nr:isochorismate synthase [Nitrolancea sp.]
MTMSIDESVGLARLTQLLEAVQRQARRENRPLLASLTEPMPAIDPLTFFHAAASFRERALWFQPATNFALVSVGVAQSIESTGIDRFERARTAWRTLLDGAHIDGVTGKTTGPLLLGGFAFDPERVPDGQWDGFPAARFVLPRIMLTLNGSDCRVTQNVLLWPDSDAAAESLALARELDLLRDASSSQLQPARAATLETSEVRPPAEWQAIVADAANAIRAGEMQKVVLAREVYLQADAALDITAALERLSATYPTCYVFAMARGERTFLGATPERLVRFEDGELTAACLAGSERRGATADEDRQLGESLWASEKNREEHDIVVRVLREGLGSLCDELTIPDEPVLLSVSNVHHLYTPVSARPRAGVGLLDAVERLHPTPAVGGFPRETALGFIREHEGFDRGWYAGSIGWLGHAGDGEFAVALRSALVDGANAALFAGCGIMGDSDPEREYDETWLKFRPMLAALGGKAH